MFQSRGKKGLPLGRSLSGVHIRVSKVWLCSFQAVVKVVIQGGGVKHLVTMATSEHMIMQNEALVALGLTAGLDLGRRLGVSM